MVLEKENTTEKEKTQVALAILVHSDGKILVGERTESEGRYIGFLELIGGKINAGEHPTDAVAREIREELGLEFNFRVEKQLPPYDFTYPNGSTFTIFPYLCRYLSGEVRPVVHKRLAWLTPQEILNSNFLEGNRQLFEQISQNPSLLLK